MQRRFPVKKYYTCGLSCNSWLTNIRRSLSWVAMSGFVNSGFVLIPLNNHHSNESQKSICDAVAVLGVTAWSIVHCPATAGAVLHTSHSN
jgi:hypothetical protein